MKKILLVTLSLLIGCTQSQAESSAHCFNSVANYLKTIPKFKVTEFWYDQIESMCVIWNNDSSQIIKEIKKAYNEKIYNRASYRIFIS